MPAFRLLVIADVHYTSDAAAAAAAPPQRHCLLGRELLRRAVEDAKRRGGLGAIALMGDLIDDGRAPCARADLLALRKEIETAAPGIPLLVVGGNHDNQDNLVLDVFAAHPGLTELGGYRFVTFRDAYAQDKYGSRPESDRRLPRELAARPGGPIVALQHNPLHPPIEDDYPYMLADGDGVLADYAEAGVLLSVSGHYHAGQPLSIRDGVRYYTAPALAEPPFRYAVVSLHGREVSIAERRLAADAPGLIDVHVHTELSYCGPGMSAAAAVQRARTMGLAGLVLTEHAPQLYCRGEDFWAGRHVRQPALWRSGEHSRMAAFRKLVGPLRGGFVRAGLEVELDADGELTLHEADRDWIDLVVGAVHFLPHDTEGLSDAEAALAVMRVNERILAAGVDVLAHPWRIFRALKRPVPTNLYGELAGLLADAGAAAEINLHIGDTDVAFIRACVERGAKIAFGSDAHEMWEAGLLGRHLEILQEAAGRQDVADLLMA